MSKILTESAPTKFGKKYALVYCRVSTGEQASHGLSIEAQESLCIKQANQDGYEIFKVIKDEGRSGSSIKGRPGMKEVMNLVADKKVEAVYAVHSDRIARNVTDHVHLRDDIFRKNDVLLKFTQQVSCDTSSATSKMSDTMLATINQYYRDQCSEKVITTMTKKAEAGYLPNKAPLGYKNIQNPNPSLEKFGQKIVAVDPSTAPFIKKAFELYATGNYNVFDLGDILFERGLRTKYGKQLSHSRMFDVLKNRFYLGELHWGKVHLKTAKHPAIIDEDLFNTVQRILASKNHHACRRRKFSWLLSGYLWCYTHNCRYTAEWHLKKSIGYYHCRNRNGCGKYIEIGKMEEMVAEKFKTLEFSQEFIYKVIEKAKGIFYDRRKTYEDKRKGLVNQRTALEIKRKMAEDKLFANVISDDDFTRIKKEISEDIQNIDDRLIELEQHRNVNVDVAQEILNLTRNIYDAYKKASPKLKRQYLGFFWDRFEVADGLIIKSTSSLLFDQLLKLEQAYQKDQNTNKSNDSVGFINSIERLRRQGSNLRPIAYT